MEASDLSAGFYDGDLAIEGDFTPPTLVSVVDGDLRVSGKLSTESVDGMDGHATLIVFGDLRCGGLVNDWASLLVVTGSLIADEWIFAAREDSALVVGGDLRTPIFVGADKWASVGGSAWMEDGYGYAVALASFDDASGAPQVHPRRSWENLVDRLGLDRERVREEHDLIRALEERLYETGGLTRAA
ncbi:MAG TPA: hypothetical protein VN158_16720 [Caulobacter sp.]|nr:hypothetical protein [Caulobacter sp.]